MTMKETVFNSKQYAIIHHVHIGIHDTGLLLGDVKIWHRVTVIDHAALFSEYLFFVRVCMQIAYNQWHFTGCLLLSKPLLWQLL